ncbi:MAG: rhodanese-like domain-containing protein [Gammaproteobacteria bacterium]|nr:rhodanese-like domain-containing protein [Gammaproteobacteria bacterium]
MKSTAKTITAGLLLSISATAFAIQDSDLPAKKQTEFKLYVTASEAHDMINKNQQKTLFVDIRTRAEVNFLGTPTMIDANIPYMTPDMWSEWDEKKRNFKLAANSDFLSAIDNRMKTKGLDKNDTLVLMCRSGSRSSKAANLLKKAGYTNVYTIVDGFEGDKAQKGDKKGQRVVNGWKNSDLPWSYKLDKSKMYFEL